MVKIRTASTSTTSCSVEAGSTNIVDLYLGSLRALGIDTEVNDIRFVEEPFGKTRRSALGARWMNGMRNVTRFHVLPAGGRP